MRVAPDPAPLWLPSDEATTDRKVSGAPPDRVEGWSWGALALTGIVGTSSKFASRAGLVVALLALALTWPALAADNAFGMVQVAVWQAIAVGLLLFATRPVRSFSAGSTVVFWLAGFFIAALAVHVIDLGLERVTALEGRPILALRPFVAAIVLLVVTLVGCATARRRWEYPGLADLLVAGYSVGAGFAAHQDGLWSRTDALSVLEGTHATWTALLALAIGLFIFHPRGDLALLVGPALLFLVLADAILLNFRWLPTCLLLAAVAGCIHFDQRRLEQIAKRDHLFPDATEGHADLLVSRYRRLRHGVHNALSMREPQWPPAHDAPVAELAQLAHVAGVEIGRGTSREGWERNPDDPNGSSDRFFGDDGWTTYVAGPEGLRREASRGRPGASLTDPPAGTEAWAAEAPGIILVGVGIALVGLVFLTLSSAALGGATLAAAPDAPGMLRTLLGAVGAGAALIGPGRAPIAESWELGPPGSSGA